MKLLSLAGILVVATTLAAFRQAPVIEWRIRVESVAGDSVVAQLKYVTTFPDGRSESRRRVTPFEVHVDSPALTCLVQAEQRDKRLKVSITRVVDDKVGRTAAGTYATTACWARFDEFGVFGN